MHSSRYLKKLYSLFHRLECDGSYSFMYEAQGKNIKKNTIDEGATFTVGDVIGFSCKDGYVTTENNFAECQADGTWNTVGPGCVKGKYLRPSASGHKHDFVNNAHFT